jgi:hypothetical protein
MSDGPPGGGRGGVANTGFPKRTARSPAVVDLALLLLGGHTSAADGFFLIHTFTAGNG